MKLLVNTRTLSGPVAGIGHYTRELLREILQQQQAGMGDQSLELMSMQRGQVVPLWSTVEPPLSSAAISDNGYRGVLTSLARRYLRHPLTRQAQRALWAHRLGQQLREQPALVEALYWEPCFVSLPWPGRTVVTVHDLSHRRLPDHHPRERVNFYNRYLPSSLERATRVHVVSQFTAEELRSLYDIEPERIDIVAPGVSERFFAATDAAQQRVRQRYRLPNRYYLSVGTLEPRKNLGRLMTAFLDLSLARQQACPLLLVGQQGWGPREHSARVRAAIADGRIRQLGYVDDADMPALYAMATAFLYVSCYEGFGMPIIEAMAAGVPVVTANRTATREVGQGAALLVDPEDTVAIREAIVRIMEDYTLAQELIRAGRLRAHQFTWSRSADTLLASFRHALGQ